MAIAYRARSDSHNAVLSLFRANAAEVMIHFALQGFLMDRDDEPFQGWNIRFHRWSPACHN